MGTLGGIFNSARSALQSDQLAIDTTAQNIKNQNTPGYVRRTVTWSETDTVQIGQNNVSVGTTAAVTAQRDRILDRSVQQATDTAAASSTRLAALQRIEGLFAIGSSGQDSSGIGAALSGFFSAVGAAAADPAGANAQGGVTTAAQAVSDSFNRSATQLDAQLTTLNQQVASGVTQVNGLLSQIASLNGQIGSAGGDTAASLQDQRTALITQLSGYVGVHQATAENDTVTLTTGNGALLVAGSQAYQLGTADVSGGVRVLSSASQGSADITSDLEGGSISGSVQARDGDLRGVQVQLDNLAFSFANAVNTQNGAGTSSSGSRGTPIFSVSATAIGAASSVQVSPGAVFASAATGEGSGGNTNANALLSLQTAKLTAGQSFSDTFATLLSGLGATTADVKTANAANAANQTQLSAQRDQASGVSLDTEAANLTQYQRTYQASAKLLSILNSLMATAINIGSNTPVQ